MEWMTSAPAFVLFVGAYVLETGARRRHRAAAQRRDGVQQLRHLRHLLERMPAHRGMVNALLQGDTSFRAKLGTQQQHIERDLAALADGLRVAPHFPAGAVRLAQIYNQWRALVHHYSQWDAQESFAAHTRVIAEVLYLMSDVGEAAGLFPAGRSDAMLLPNTAINLLPPVTETLGQARGIATGIAARGKCTAANRVKLQYVIKKVRGLCLDMATSVERVLAQHPDLKARAAALVGESRAATGAFMDMLEQRIVGVSTVELKPDACYQAGTHAIEKSFALLDILLDTLDARVRAQAAGGLPLERLWVLLALAASGVLVVW